MSDEPPMSWQGGLSNEELEREFRKKLPNVQPTERELSCFALGVEVGASIVRPGWVSVPSEPTQHMLSIDAPPCSDDIREGEPMNWKYRRSIWRQMLSRAPGKS